MSKRKIVIFDEMDIFLRDRVGILLTKRMAINTVKNGVNFLSIDLFIYIFLLVLHHLEYANNYI